MFEKCDRTKTHWKEFNFCLIFQDCINLFRGVPWLKLIPYISPDSKSDRIPGRLAGQIKISDDFNEPDISVLF